MKEKRGQISMEYLILIGFTSFVIISILAVSFMYSNNFKTEIKSNQIQEFANKIVSTAESVFYSGEPSKATITAYLPEGVKAIEIISNNLVITYNSGYGSTVTAFASKVPIKGSINISSGMKKIQLIADENNVTITQL